MSSRKRVIEQIEYYVKWCGTPTEKRKLKDALSTLKKNESKEPKDDPAFGNPWQ